MEQPGFSVLAEARYLDVWLQKINTITISTNSLFGIASLSEPALEEIAKPAAEDGEEKPAPVMMASTGCETTGETTAGVLCTRARDNIRGSLEPLPRILLHPEY